MKGDAGSPADAVAAGGDETVGSATAAAAYRIELPEFEGPLDLLLHLCKTHELDIVHIPIAFITEKYLEYLETMQAMSVEVAAEYLVMAATLAYLKARELVPTRSRWRGGRGRRGGAGPARGADPPAARVPEVQGRGREARAAGRSRGATSFARGVRLEPIDDKGELAEHSVWKLIESFADLLQKAGGKITHDVVVDRVSLGDRINQIIDQLEAGGGQLPVRRADRHDAARGRSCGTSWWSRCWPSWSWPSCR